VEAVAAAAAAAVDAAEGKGARVMQFISLNNLYKTYHLGEMDVPVLKGVSMEVARGELVALMGASGSGKSTLMNILGCLDRPTSGTYLLDGRITTRMGAAASDSVTDSYGRTWDVDNLVVADGGVFTSNAHKNPTLTIMALAWRSMDKLADRMKKGEI